MAAICFDQKMIRRRQRPTRRYEAADSRRLICPCERRALPHQGNSGRGDWFCCRREGTKEKPRQKKGGTSIWVRGGRLAFSLHKAIPPSFTLHKVKVPCLPRAKKWPRCRRGQFLPDTQIYWSRFFLPVPRQFGAWGIGPLSSPASVNCVRAEGLSRLTSLLRETRLRGWACETRTQKCRRKRSL